ncbi:V-type proton ATPase 16 kDa proteolipid subunit, partial [Dichanthelium oligosanthes]
LPLALSQGQNRPPRSAVALSSSSPAPPTRSSDQIGEAKSQAEERNLERSCRRLRLRHESFPGPAYLRSTSTSGSRKRKMSSVFSGDETAPFFGFLGAAAALVFSCSYYPNPLSSPLFYFLFRSLEFGWGKGMGAAYGTAKSGVGVASMGVMRPELVMKSIVPVVMAGVLGIYGLIIAVIISTGINPKAKPYYLFDGYAHLSSGLACGLAGLAAGMAIGIVGDAGVRYRPFALSYRAMVIPRLADQQLVAVVHDERRPGGPSSIHIEIIAIAASAPCGRVGCVDVGTAQARVGEAVRDGLRQRVLPLRAQLDCVVVYSGQYSGTGSTAAASAAVGPSLHGGVDEDPQFWHALFAAFAEGLGFFHSCSTSTASFLGGVLRFDLRNR